MFAYSALGRGFFSGLVSSAQPEKAGDVLDAAAMKGYACPANFERLRRCELLAAEKGLTVPEVAMAWLFSQPLDVYALVSTASKARMEMNIASSMIRLTREECSWLDLESER